MPSGATDSWRTGDPQSQEPAHTLERDTLVAERYRLQRRLGSGGSGVVYEAHDEARAHARVALKLLVSRQPRALMRLKNEYRALARMAHPNLVALHGLGVDEHGWFVVMDLVEPSRELVTYVRTCPSQLRGALAQLLRGVAALHAAGKLHRDLKPSNVLVDARGRVVIVDFGLLAESELEAGQFVGTPAYAAPEQLRGRPVAASADLYAVGVMLYESLTGRLPFDPHDDEALLVDKIAAAIELPPEVEPRLAALCRALLAPDPAQRPTADQALAQLGEHDAHGSLAREQVPFVARTRELRQLLATLARTHQEGGARVALMSGASGIGKTALSARFAERAREELGALVLSGRCHPLEQVPYKAFDSLIDALANHLARLPDVEAAALMPRNVALLARLFPALATVPVVTRVPEPLRELTREGDPTLVRSRAFAAFKELLARLGDLGPLLLTLDDLQWSDADSLELLRELLRGPDAPSCLVLCTLRSDQPRPPLLGELRAKLASWQELPLGPLSSASTLRLARALLGPAADPRLIAESAGSPLLLEQLARAARTHGAPRDLRETVRAQLDAEPGRALIELVCVAGHPIAVELAARAASLEPAVLQRTMRCWLLHAQVEHGVELLEPRHDRLRETVLETLSAEHTRALHGRLADALLHAPAPDPEQLAQHLCAADRHDDAAPYLAEAAARAMDALAFARAEQLYRQALLHAWQGRFALEFQLARAECNQGKLQDAADRMERLLARCSDPDMRHQLASEAMMLHALAGRVRRGARLLDQACRELGQPPVPRSRGLALLAVGTQLVRYMAGPRIASLPVPTRAAHHGSSRRELELCLRATRGFALGAPTYGEYFALRAMLAIRRTRDPDYWPVGIAWDVLRRSIFAGRAELEDDAEMARALELARASGDPETLALVWGAEGARCYMVAELARCCEGFTESERVLLACGRALSPIYNGARNGQLAALLTLGRMRDARALAGSWAEEALALGDRFGALMVRVMGGYARLAADDLQGAREANAALDDPIIQQTLMPVEPWWRGEQYIYEGEPEAAWAVYRRASAHSLFYAASRAPAHRTITRVLAGRLHLMLAQRRDRARHLRAAEALARSLARERHPLAPPGAAQLRAGIAMLNDDLERALRELKHAREGYLGTGTVLHEAAMRYWAGVLTAGDQGRAWRESARSEAHKCGVSSPERWFAMTLPTFPKA